MLSWFISSAFIRHRQLLSMVPGVFILADESRHSTSCIGIIQSIDFDFDSARIISCDTQFALLRISVLKITRSLVVALLYQPSDVSLSCVPV